MADTKITDLTPLTAATGDEIPINRAGADGKVTVGGIAALAFALDRDGPPYVIKNNIGAVITDVACAPIFLGSHYPIGGYT